MADWQEYQAKLAQLETEKADFARSQEIDQATKEAAGEQFVPEEKEWPTFDEPVISKKNREFVVCMDTMGQDRVFSEKDKEFALKSIYRFRKHWEDFEEAKLKADRDALINQKDEDNELFDEAKLADLAAAETQIVESFLNPEDEEEKKDGPTSAPRAASKLSKEASKKSMPTNEEEKEEVDHYAVYEQKQEQVGCIKMKYQIDLLTNDEEFKKRFECLPNMKVVKHTKVMKCLFYLLEYEKD